MPDTTGNLYYNSNSTNNENTSSSVDPNATTVYHVRDGTFYNDPKTRELKIGKMPEVHIPTTQLDPGETIRIPKGYHDGTEIVYAKDITSLTLGTATPSDIAFNKVAYVNGRKLIGTLNIRANSMEGNATSSDIKEGKICWVDGNRVIGSMPVLSTENHVLDAGMSYVIPKGYHGGNDVIEAKSLSAQTIADATASNIELGKTAWVNGNKVIGTKLPLSEATRGTATSSYIRSSRTAWVNGSFIIGSMEEYMNMGIKVLNPGSTYVIPEGYHDGTGSIEVKRLSELTISNATSADIKIGKSAWVNGEYIQGSLTDVSPASTEGTATAKDIRLGRTAWVNGNKVIGRSKNNTIKYSRVFSNSQNSSNPASIILPDDWYVIDFIHVFEYDADNKLLYTYLYEDYYNGSSDEIYRNNGDIDNYIILDSEYGSRKLSVKNTDTTTYISVIVSGYKVNIN